MNVHRPFRRGRMARRLALTKTAFTFGLVALTLALIGTGQVVDRVSGSAADALQRQVDTPPTDVDANLVRLLADIPAGGDTAPPLILTYHEISPIEDSTYTLTPAAFETQMRMLAEAGYRSVRTADVVRWLDGGSMPPKSVFITFDDGAAGVWRYADPILARYGFTASAFIITSYPGRGPRYMTWPQIEYLARSGRWDIGAHTHDGHRYVLTSAAEADGAFLTTRAWLAESGRLETDAEYQTRVSNDLSRCIAELNAHGIANPQLLAFPFSAATSDEPVLNAFLSDLTGGMFRGSLLDSPRGAVTLPEEKAVRKLRRLNVLRRFDGATFVDQVADSSALREGEGYELFQPGSWRPTTTSGTFSGDAGRVTLQVPATGWASIEYRPTRTVYWRDYSVAVTAAGLSTTSDLAGGVSLRTGTPGQISIGVSAGWLRVLVGRPGRTVYEGPLRRADRHSIWVSATGSRVEVRVDGNLEFTDEHVPSGTGGVGLFGTTARSAASVHFINGWAGPAAPSR